MNLGFIDWIWRVRGRLALAPGLSRDDVFDRLGALFRQDGASHKWTGDTLTFSKKDHAAQDRLSIFDSGVLRVDEGPGGKVLSYNLMSRALLMCFLAPILFFGIGRFTIEIAKFEKTPPEAAKKETVIPMNPIDKALGAPPPDKTKKDDKAKAGKHDKKPSPKAAYIFAEIFAGLYVIGRILEDRLVRSLFKKRMLEA